MNKEISEILRKLEAQGWRVVPGAGHIRAFPPDLSKSMVTIPTTPSGGRWRQNLIAQLRRSGADL